MWFYEHTHTQCAHSLALGLVTAGSWAAPPPVALRVFGETCEQSAQWDLLPVSSVASSLTLWTRMFRKPPGSLCCFLVAPVTGVGHQDLALGSSPPPVVTAPGFPPVPLNRTILPRRSDWCRRNALVLFWTVLGLQASEGSCSAFKGDGALDTHSSPAFSTGHCRAAASRPAGRRWSGALPGLRSLRLRSRRGLGGSSVFLMVFFEAPKVLLWTASS